MFVNGKVIVAWSELIYQGGILYRLSMRATLAVMFASLHPEIGQVMRTQLTTPLVSTFDSDSIDGVHYIYSQ